MVKNITLHSICSATNFSLYIMCRRVPYTFFALKARELLHGLQKGLLPADGGGGQNSGSGLVVGLNKRFTSNVFLGLSEELFQGITNVVISI